VLGVFVVEVEEGVGVVKVVEVIEVVE